ncbi:RodZ domain-containing protein [Ferrimonas lipolytica]|uniref:DUF4115 domain-containing protein n=1 Tax=Ferrimonas lipolytica TaxID=2724191 RepID=A0A6H1UDS1_9GAMM|nr:RodZ domain-containing protein [Ferrimonas lipolytica]QIZ76988.1 DUF4115 domain-containing protein [Ferrimonas lipolytica]
MTEELNNEPALTGPGTLLRDAREQMGLSTQQVAQRLNLRHSVVVGIEADHYEPGMSITYIRGYIRNYARLVGLNEKELNSALDSISLPEPEPEMHSFSDKTKRDRSDSRWRLLTWGIGLSLVAALGWWVMSLQSGDQQSLNLPEPTNLAELERQSNPVVTTPPAVAVVAPTPIEQSVSINSTTEPAVAVVDAPETEVELVAATEQPVEQAVAVEAQAVAETLTVSLSADCWMLIQDANGEKLVEGLKPQGFTTSLGGSAPYKLRLGAPEAVTLSYNGTAVDLSSFSAGKVARLTVPR